MTNWPSSVEDDELRSRLVQGVRDAVDRASVDPERAYNLYHYMRAYIRDCRGGQDWGLFVTRRDHPQNLHGFDYALNMMRLHYPHHAGKLEEYMRECGFEPEPYPAHVQYWKGPYRTASIVENNSQEDVEEMELRAAELKKVKETFLPSTYRPATWWERLTKDVYVKEDA